MRSGAIGRLVGALVLAVLLPSGAQAFSFGTFAAGEQILSIQVANGQVDFTRTTNMLVFDGDISTITTNLGTYNVPLGDVYFNSQVTIVGGSEIAQPDPFGAVIAADFVNGLVADMTILDVADGFNPLLEANYIGNLSFNALLLAGTVNGSMGSDFLITGGDTAFTNHFGLEGNYFADLASFLVNGTPVGGNFNSLVYPPGCFPGSCEINDFEVATDTTIVPTVLVPEPTTGVLVLLGLSILGVHPNRSRH